MKLWFSDFSWDKKLLLCQRPICLYKADVVVFNTEHTFHTLSLNLILECLSATRIALSLSETKTVYRRKHSNPFFLKLTCTSTRNHIIFLLRPPVFFFVLKKKIQTAPVCHGLKKNRIIVFIFLCSIYLSGGISLYVCLYVFPSCHMHKKVDIWYGEWAWLPGTPTHYRR